MTKYLYGLMLGILLSVMITSRSPGQSPPQGLAFAAVPSLSYSSGEGWEYGGKLFFYQFGKGNIQPYRWHLLINAAQTTEEKRDVYAFLDMPHIWGPATRMDIKLEYKKFGLEDFYGLGNRPDYRKEVADPEQPDFLSDVYYNYKHRWSACYINAQWPLRDRHVKLLAGAALVRTRLSAYPPPNLLHEQPQAGMAGGYSNYVRTGLVIDRRDQEAMPTSGYWSDLLIEKCVKLLGSDYDYTRITLTDRHYFKLLPRLVYAQRLLLEHMPGYPPFYEMAVISSSYQRFEGLGSGRSMRGVPRLLFVGPSKLLMNLELRWRMMDLRLLKQELTFYGHLFADGGRVWLRNDEKKLKHLHFAEGIGVHVQWKKELIGALDIGRSAWNDMAIYLTFGNLF